MELLFLFAFLAIILGILFTDLLVIGRNTHVLPMREALAWTILWVALAMAFYFFLRYFGHILHGIEDIEGLNKVMALYDPSRVLTGDFQAQLEQYRKIMSLNYLSGYFIEETLSVDNIFVILMILHGFSVPKKNYKEVLFWGILGAIVLRFIFIFAGAALVHRFEWLLIVFGIFLLYQGAKILFKKEEKEQDPHNHPIVKYLSNHIRIHPKYVGDKFRVKIDGTYYFTPLMLVLVIIEFTDLLFAMDSIPAVFAVSRDPYIVFFSNIFAIIGLRSLFFLIANLVDKFRFLKPGVALLLGFVGFKLIFHEWLDRINFQPVYSLYIIGGILVMSVVLSIIFPKKEK